MTKGHNTYSLFANNIIHIVVMGALRAEMGGSKAAEMSFRSRAPEILFLKFSYKDKKEMDLVAEYNHKMKVFHDIVGCAMDVYNEYRFGLTEYPYQYGLKHLLRKLGYRVEKEYELPLYLFGEKLEEKYRCDLVMVRPEGDIIIECKAVSHVDEGHRAQLANYMLLTHCPFGILINFCKTKSYLYSETYKYNSDTHKVERYDTKYMGMMYEKTKKPWQPYLDKKREPGEEYFHHINIDE